MSDLTLNTNILSKKENSNKINYLKSIYTYGNKLISPNYGSRFSMSRTLGSGSKNSSGIATAGGNIFEWII